MGLFDVRQLAVGGFDHNFSYLVIGAGGEAALIDPTGDLEVIRRAVEAAGSGLKSAYILLTHAHPDHMENVAGVRSFFPAPVLAHPQGRCAGAIPLIDGQSLPLGDGEIEVIFTPGHSADSVVYRLSDNSGLFTGDTLFISCCGFGRPDTLFDSLNRLKKLSHSLVIYSGHDYGDKPTATLGEELRTNLYLQCATREEFREAMRHLT